jgi:copper chaperone
MTLKLKVDGMTCGHCEMTVKKALGRVPGVERVVSVDRARGLAIVEGTADPELLCGVVEAEGYSAEVVP